MSYTALYRKYRPSAFEDVKGQDHIVTTLKNQIRADRIGHAYLFCGTRGTGKTTVAKIFARAVNCEHPVDGSPCGECDSCRSIANGSSMNVIEIDAASNNSVDNIRQIKEEVAYAPTEGHYKVYIIDEVHMLSAGAFNALLKTLEEPPSYVIFILATTEAHRIPVTILSRCQRYDFHRISLDTITARLKELMEREGVETEEKALRYVARAADGSMRDALSLLDQCISFYIGKKLTYENVLEVLGAVDTEVFSRLLRCIIRDDVPGAIQVVEDLIMQGRELGQFVTDFIWYLRNLMFVKASDAMDEALDMSEENLAVLKEEAQMLDTEIIMRYIRVLSELSNDMRFSSQKRVMLEIAVIRLCRPAMEQSQEALTDRVAKLERKMEQGMPIAAVSPVSERNETTVSGGNSGNEEDRVKKMQTLAKALPEEIRKIAANWKSVISDFPGLTRNSLAKAFLSPGEGNQLILVFKDEIAYNSVAEESRLQKIREALAQKTGKEIDVIPRYVPDSREVQDSYIDLQSLVNMDITVDDSDNEAF